MLPADQLVRHGDSDDVADAVPAAQVKRAEMVDIAYQTDDRPGDAAADECLAAGGSDQRHNGINISLSHFGSHHDHHLVLLVPSLTTKKPPAIRPGAWSLLPLSASARPQAGYLPGTG